MISNAQRVKVEESVVENIEELRVKRVIHQKNFNVGVGGVLLANSVHESKAN